MTSIMTLTDTILDHIPKPATLGRVPADAPKRRRSRRG